MREIKFRGWDKDTNRWYYGSYVRLERTSPYAMSQFPEEDNKKFEDEQVDHYIFFTEMNDWGLETKKLRASVDPKSVGQYTGLKDKNGKDIYEDDIVAYHSFTRRLGEQYHKRIVQWNTQGAHFEMTKISKYSDDPKAGQRSFFADYKNKKLEVIGNIHDTPHLLDPSAR